jgi:hypothetical protein
MVIEDMNLMLQNTSNDVRVYFFKASERVHVTEFNQQVRHYNTELEKPTEKLKTCVLLTWTTSMEGSLTCMHAIEYILTEKDKPP